ncbi:hypothetical protein M8J76_002739 [Diaphorina citri]|nr:hypothetical protein M8J76_002739 [Diaphorina citri]
MYRMRQNVRRTRQHARMMHASEVGVDILLARRNARVRFVFPRSLPSRQVYKPGSRQYQLSREVTLVERT